MFGAANILRLYKEKFHRARRCRFAVAIAAFMASSPESDSLLDIHDVGLYPALVIVGELTRWVGSVH
jgi:hypothetical protein